MVTRGQGGLTSQVPAAQPPCSDRVRVEQTGAGTDLVHLASSRAPDTIFCNRPGGRGQEMQLECVPQRGWMNGPMSNRERPPRSTHLRRDTQCQLLTGQMCWERAEQWSHYQGAEQFHRLESIE